MRDILVFALPTGRLLRPITEVLERAGLPTPPSGGRAERRLRVRNGDVEMLFAKDQDVPVYVEHGAADIGVAGRDVLEELEQDGRLYEPLDLGVGRCRMVLARPADRPLPEPPYRVATKYPVAARRHFGRRGFPVELIRLSGSIELAPQVDLADAVVDLVETGRTLSENGLVEEETLFESSARVVVNRSSFRLRSRAVGSAIARLGEAARTMVPTERG